MSERDVIARFAQDAPIDHVCHRVYQDTMTTFMYLGKYTADGLKGLADEGGTQRRVATERLITSIGGSIREYWFAIGEYDFVLMVDLPDDAAGLVAPILTGASGTVRVLTVPLVSPEQIDEVCSRIGSGSFRPAGHGEG